MGKLVSLLDEGALFFAKAKELDDPYEGTLTSASLAKIREVDDFQPLFGFTLNRNMVFVNSWYQSECESAAMWKLYAGAGLAIESTFTSLRECFHDTPGNVFIGQVQYIDYGSDRIQHDDNFFNTFMSKRRAFEHEHELRALVQEFWRPKDPGMFVPCDVNRLIRGIWVSPNSPSYLRKAAIAVCKKFGVDDALVRPSELDAPPIL